MRISTAASPVDVSNLFDSLDYLKFKVTPAQLALVDRRGIEQDVGAERRRPRSIRLYATLLDLKTSHPETSFGARADYLMRGLQSFGDNVEIARITQACCV